MYEPRTASGSPSSYRQTLKTRTVVSRAIFALKAMQQHGGAGCEGRAKSRRADIIVETEEKKAQFK